MTKPSLRALLVEDSITDAELAVRELGRLGPLEWERVEEADGMRNALSSREWDVIISAWSMPRFNALEALEILRGTSLDIPLIIVSGAIGQDQAVEAIRAGARDYVLKDKLTRLSIAVEREVSERAGRDAHRQTEQALGLSEARFARLAESGIIGVCTGDVSGLVHDANDAYLRMLGYTRDDLAAGRVSWIARTASNWKQADQSALEQLRNGGVARPWEKDLIARDGRLIPVLTGVAMLNETDCIVFAADLSERKQAEEALRHSEERFRQAQKMEAIGNLAGGIAHDFNNLLSVILSYATLLSEDDIVDAERTEYLSEISQAARRAATLTHQLLAFSRQQVLRPRLVNINNIIEGIEKMFARVIGEHIELVSVLDPDLARVEVAPGQLEQVLMNLVVNARDAMPEGGILTIRTTNSIPDRSDELPAGFAEKNRVILEVIDTGTGMDAATQSRMFEPFFTTKGAFMGTGLGLSTVFGIVKQSGGQIDVESEIGRGSTFRIALPSNDTGQSDEYPVYATPIFERVAGSETILLVEDNESLRTLTHKLLGREGYRVLEAATASDALALCEQNLGKIDMLLTDVVMPRMNGRQLAERVTVLSPDIKVLYMSGHTDVLQAGGANGESTLLKKPFTPESLLLKVREVLDAVE